MALVIVGLIAIAALWGLIEPFVGLLGLVAVNIIQPGELYPTLAPLHLEKVMAIIVLGSFFAHQNRFKLAPITRWSLAFFATVVASIPLSVWISNSLNAAIEFGKTMVYLLLITGLVTTRRRVFWFLLVFALLIGYLAASALASYYSGTFAYAEGFDRIVGLTSDANTTDGLALTMASAVPLILLLVGRGTPKVVRLLALGIAGGALWTMLLTGSRITLLAFLVSTCVFVLTSRRRASLGPTLLVVALAIWIALPQQYKNRYAHQTSSAYLAQDDAYQGRLRIWLSGWRMFLDHPLTGVGVGDFNMADGSYYWPHHWMDAHNLLIKALGELGLLGTAVFVGFVVCLVRTNRALDRAMADRADIPPWQRYYPRAANLLIITLLVAGYGAHDLYRDSWYFVAGLSGGLWILLSQDGVAPTLASARNTSAPAHLPAKLEPTRL